MEFRPDTEKALRDYLLGDLSPEQHERVELWLMSEKTACDLLAAEEDALIDDSLAGNLTGSQLSKFNSYFLTAPERQRKLRFGRSLKRFIEAETRDSTLPAASASSTPSAFSFWGTLAQCFRYRPVTSYAATALVVLMVGVSVWSTFTTAQLKRNLDFTISRLNQSEKLQAPLGALERIVATKNVEPSQGLLAFDLIPGVTRGPTDIRQIPLTRNLDDVVLMSLTLENDVYKQYNVVLHDPDGREKFTRAGLLAITTAAGKAVVVSVLNSELLDDGAYQLKLIGVSDSSEAEEIGNYAFRPARQ